jgi:hypothetical protein
MAFAAKIADTDLIARLYTNENIDDYELKAIQTSSHYVPPPLQRPRPRVLRGRGERERTEPPEEPEQSNSSAHHYKPCLEIRFSDIPRGPHGVVFGWDPNSDVVLPALLGVSYHHFTLTFDDKRRPIVKDCSTLVGTEVTYENQGQGKRSGFQWIIGGHPVPQRIEAIIIKVNNWIQFQIVVAHHNITSPGYINGVEQFCQGTATAEDLFHDLNFPHRQETERPTGSHTPGTGDIHLRKRIGEGAFGAVTHMWNVSTGEEFVLKAPTAKAVRKGQVDVNEWRNEAHIMSLISHVRLPPPSPGISL